MAFPFKYSPNKINLLQTFKKIFYKSANNKFKNKVNKLVADSKISYFVNKFNSCKQNLKKTWNVINDLTGNKRPTKEIRKLLINYSQTTDERELSVVFVEHFCIIVI